MMRGLSARRRRVWIAAVAAPLACGLHSAIDELQSPIASGEGGSAAFVDLTEAEFQASPAIADDVVVGEQGHAGQTDSNSRVGACLNGTNTELADLPQGDGLMTNRASDGEFIANAAMGTSLNVDDESLGIVLTSMAESRDSATTPVRQPIVIEPLDSPPIPMNDGEVGEETSSSDDMSPVSQGWTPVTTIQEFKEEQDRNQDVRKALARGIVARRNFTSIVRAWIIHLGVLLLGMAVVVLTVLANAEVLAASSSFRVRLTAPDMVVPN